MWEIHQLAITTLMLCNKAPQTSGLKQLCNKPQTDGLKQLSFISMDLQIDCGSCPPGCGDWGGFIPHTGHPPLKAKKLARAHERPLRFRFRTILTLPTPNHMQVTWINTKSRGREILSTHSKAMVRVGYR